MVEDTGDLIKACKILYGAYTNAGFMRPDRSGYRFTAYHALPYCYTAVAKVAGEIVATATIVVRSADPLPIESLFEIDAYCGPGRRPAEVSGLAVSPEYRNRGRVLFPLLKYIYHYAERRLGVTDFVVTVNPRHVPFWRGVLLFDVLPGDSAPSYDFVDGAPAVGVALRLETVPAKYARAYRGRPAGASMYEYMVERQFPQYEIPRGSVSVYDGNRWTPTELSYLLTHLATGASSLNAREVGYLESAYGPAYAGVIDDYRASLGEASAASPQTHGRLDLNLAGRLRVGRRAGSEALPVRILALHGDEVVIDNAPGYPAATEWAGATLTVDSLADLAFSLAYRGPDARGRNNFAIDGGVARLRDWSERHLRRLPDVLPSEPPRAFSPSPAP